jgi:toxin CcdB
MPQFSVYLNANPDSKAIYPFLLDVQSDLIADLATRVVIPLSPASALQGKLVNTLMPLCEVEGLQYALLVPQLAGVSRKQLGAEVADLSSRRDDIMAALDLLITGI